MESIGCMIALTQIVRCRGTVWSHVLQLPLHLRISQPLTTFLIEPQPSAVPATGCRSAAAATGSDAAPPSDWDMTLRSGSSGVIQRQHEWVKIKNPFSSFCKYPATNTGAREKTDTEKHYSKSVLWWCNPPAFSSFLLDLTLMPTVYPVSACFG